jgi:xanthine dehydrogenase small subunit
MISFILNNQLINTDKPAGSTMLDFVRYQKRLMGTKIGCREGDCGACTVLVGAFENEKLVYRSMTSCLMPLANAQGKHIVTVEGINQNELTPVQQAMVDTNGTQCGFCTIGFVMSLTGFAMNASSFDYTDAIKSIDGNICRCTGYKSIERAAKILSHKLANRKPGDLTGWLVENSFVPAYFLTIKDRLKQIENSISPHAEKDALIIGGGTDLIVQKHGTVKRSIISNFFDSGDLKQMGTADGRVSIGASVTVTEFAESPIIKNIFPDLSKHIKLVSSTPIRNMATLAGNLVNASPIGDMTVFFLALHADLLLSSKRIVKLNEFYTGYKQLNKTAEEHIEQIIFTIPPANAVFGFEKVCKRTFLDIASVNSACLLQTDKTGTIENIYLSAGGVAPYPRFLNNTCNYLKGKKIEPVMLTEAIKIMHNEIAPISDARGSKEYKRLLLRQLFLAHFQLSDKDLKTVFKPVTF